jgi:hypothetical protein
LATIDATRPHLAIQATCSRLADIGSMSFLSRRRWPFLPVLRQRSLRNCASSR